jgi:RNA polymerase sigma-70 factor (ECF subfamily)
MADRTADFDDLYRATNARLLQYAYAMTSNFATAQDVTQEAYLRAWLNWRKIEAFQHPEAWLRLVVTRIATDRWRRLRTARSVEFRSAAVEPPSENSVLLVGALRQLPVSQRRAICLHYLLDLPIAEIAVEVGVAEGTVKSWLSRGRAALADILGDEVFVDPSETTRRETQGA